MKEGETFDQLYGIQKGCTYPAFEHVLAELGRDVDNGAHGECRARGGSLSASKLASATGGVWTCQCQGLREETRTTRSRTEEESSTRACTWESRGHAAASLEQATIPEPAFFSYPHSLSKHIAAFAIPLPVARIAISQRYGGKGRTTVPLWRSVRVPTTQRFTHN